MNDQDPKKQPAVLEEKNEEVKESLAKKTPGQAEIVRDSAPRSSEASEKALELGVQQSQPEQAAKQPPRVARAQHKAPKKFHKPAHDTQDGNVQQAPSADQPPIAPKQPVVAQPLPSHHDEGHAQQRPPHQERQHAQQSHPHQPRQQHKYDHNKPRDYQHQQQRAPVAVEELSLNELNMYARRLGIVGGLLMTKPQLIERIKYVEARPDIELEVEGVLEKLPDGFGFLRSAQYDYVSGPDDVYVSPSQIRRCNLRTGDIVSGVIRKPKENEKYFALLKVTKVNYEDPTAVVDRPNFDRLSPDHPNKKFNLEYDPTCMASRIMDLFTPVGKGQRALIVAPPKVGKTMLLRELAKALIANHPEAVLMILLVDERPEEVADMKRTVRGTSAEVVSSTFDESPERHIQVAEIVLEKAKRLVEAGRDVVILLDSMTRLARAYNSTAPASGKVLTGGIDANALQRPKRFFGAARNTEEGGSLTIIASALVETGSRMDEVIYEEFKGTGNMEIHMTRKLSNRRIYPAFDLLMSGTRREDLLIPEEDLNKVWVLQKLLATMNTIEGMEFLVDKIKKVKNNREFLESINKKAATGGGSSSGASGSGS